MYIEKYVKFISNTNKNLLVCFVEFLPANYCENDRDKPSFDDKGHTVSYL